MNNISFTENAIQHIKSILDKKPNHYFRLSLKKTGCSGYMFLPELTLEKNAGDTVMELNELTVFIDTSVLSLIQGTVVDYQQKNLGLSQLVFQNPNAEGVCGCGESFQIRDQGNP